MSKFKKLDKRGWTPGPWKVESRDEHGARVTAIAPIAWCAVAYSTANGGQSVGTKQAHKNAALIAAAPELYEENQRLSKQVEQLGEALRIALEYSGSISCVKHVEETIAHALNNSGQWRESK